MRSPSPSVIALVAANTLPLVGVAFLKWELADVLLLFWAETAVIGLFNSLKMFRIAGPSAVPMVAFFAVHFGIFMFVHLMFLFTLVLGSAARNGGSDGLFESLDRLAGASVSWALALLGLIASHGFSFVVNFLGDREWERRTLEQQMGQPYGRVVVMHITILFGGFATMALGAPGVLLFLLVFGKIVIDVRSHRKERR